MELNNNNQLKFPLICPYRIIALDIPNMDFVIETVLSQIVSFKNLQKGRNSQTGKYISYNVDIHLESKDIMEKVDKELRAIEGVKVVI